MSDTLTLGEGWTDDVRVRCAIRCGEECGDPPCWSLAGDSAHGSTPQIIEPCAKCRTLATERAPQPAKEIG